jgi:hypothetical protein
MSQPSAVAQPPARLAVRAGASVPGMYLMLLAAWLFDFQSGGEGEGVEIQAFFAAAYVFSSVMLLIGDRATGQRVHGLFTLLVCGGLYLAVGIASGLINGQNPYPILRNGMSVVIYLSAAYFTARVVLASDPAKLRFVLSVFCFLYAIAAYFIFDRTSGGVDFERVRFQIIGASAVGALGYVVLAPLFKLSKIELAAMAANVIILLISVTRSFLLAFGAQAAIFIGQIRRVFSPRLIALGVLGAFALLGLLTYGQNQLIRWSDRILGGGGSGFSEYQTVYTRLSEWEFMLRAWLQSFDHFLFGSGIAEKAYYFLPREAGGGTEFMVGFGHNQIISLIFTAGLVGGLPLVLLQWMHVLRAWRFLRAVIRMPHLRTDAVFLGAWGATIILGHNATNLLASTFSGRGSSLWFGIGTGLLLGAQALFDPANVPRTAQRALPRASRYLPA